MEDTLRSLAQLHFSGDKAGMSRYLKWFFKGVDVGGKDVLDVGGGNGWLSFYCCLQNARSVTLVEPFSAGSNEAMLKQLAEGIGKFNARNLSVVNAPFPSDTISGKFDVLILHNSINHLAETDVMRLKYDPESREKYLGYLSELQRLARPNADLLIADCSNRNLFADLHLSHPISRRVNWRKHQDPDTWLELLQDAGFSKVSVTWSPYRRLGRLGWLLAANAVAAYVMTSHFRIHLRPADATPGRGRRRLIGRLYHEGTSRRNAAAL